MITQTIRLSGIPTCVIFPAHRGAKTASRSRSGASSRASATRKLLDSSRDSIHPRHLRFESRGVHGVPRVRRTMRGRYRGRLGLKGQRQRGSAAAPARRFLSLSRNRSLSCASDHGGGGEGMGFKEDEGRGGEVGSWRAGEKGDAARPGSARQSAEL